MRPEQANEASFAVAASESEVEAFRAATGCSQTGDTLPATFPMRWLASTAVRGMLMAAVPESGLVPVHEGQGFDYEWPLRVGEPYWLKLSHRREAEPPRLVVDGRVEDADGRILARLETTLRLVSIGAAA